jgi:hypothetical protein
MARFCTGTIIAGRDFERYGFNSHSGILLLGAESPPPDPSMRIDTAAKSATIMLAALTY